MTFDFKIRNWLWPIFVIFLTAGAIFVVWYFAFRYEQNKISQNPTTGTTPSTYFSASCPSCAKKTYQNNDLGIKFQYPASWEDINLMKRSDVTDLLTSIYYANEWEKSNDGIENYKFYDPSKKILFVAQSKDSKPFEWPVLNKKRVDVNWTKEQFVNEMGVEPFNILLVKKLSDKSMLVALYGSPECSPTMQLSVITPLNENYPNFEIIYLNNNFDLDKDIKSFEQSQIAKTGTSCDMLDGYQALANKIEAGTYSDDVDNFIKTAQQIADSAQTL